MSQHSAHLSRTNGVSSGHEATCCSSRRASKRIGGSARGGTRGAALSLRFDSRLGLRGSQRSGVRLGGRSVRRQVVQCSGENTSPDMSVELETDDNGVFSVDGLLRVSDVDPTSLYAMLTDHASSSRVFRNILETKELERDGNSVLLKQNCLWEFLIFSGCFNITLQVLEDIELQRFTFGITESGFMRRMEGSWNVMSHGPRDALVQYQFSVQPALSAPPPFSKYTGRIFKKQVTDILEDLHNEVERCRDASLENAQQHKYLKFVRSGDAEEPVEQACV